MTNKVILIGNLGSDLELVYFDNGGCIGKVSLATTKKWKDKQSGETKSKTAWHNLIFNNQSAETVNKYAGKGSKMYVEGELDYRSWEKDGQKHTRAEIRVFAFEFLTPKEGTNPPGPLPTQGAENPQGMGSAQSAFQKARDLPEDQLEPEDDYDDLPF